MQDDNLTPEQRRMLAFERGESLKADRKEISDYQKQQAAQWEQLGAEFTKSTTDKKANSLEAAGLRDPNTNKSGWDDIAREYSDMKATGGDRGSTESDGKAETDQSNAKQPVQIEQTAEAIQSDQSVDIPEPTQPNQPDADSNIEANQQTGDVPVESRQSLSADAERDIALAKRGAENQSTFIKSSTLQHLQARYGADNVQSLDMTSGERGQYDAMLNQASKVGSDTDNPTNINTITGVNQMDGDFTSFGKTVDSNGLGGLMQDVNRATSGSVLDDQLSIGQMKVATAAGRESEMSVASDVADMKPLDEKPRELPQNPAELKDVSEQLDTVNDQTDKTAFNPGGYGDDRAEDSLDEARAEVAAALRAQEEA